MIRISMLSSFTAFILISCGEGEPAGKKNEIEINPEGLAIKVCDCFGLANRTAAIDSLGTVAAQDSCKKLNETSWNAVKDQPELAQRFNSEISDCGSRIFQQNLKR